MRVIGFLVSLAICCALATLFGCDQLNKPMPVTTGGTSSSSGGGPSVIDAGSDAELPPLPSEGPRVTPQPGDVQL